MFTKQERLVLIVFICVVFIGTMLNFIFYKIPPIKKVENLIRNTALFSKVDLNLATAQELEAIPYIGPYTAQKIVEFRQEKGRFNSVEELKQVKGVKEKNYLKFSLYLKVKP